MIVSLGLLFEALAAVFCLYYLYNEKPKLDLVTIIFVIVEVAWMQCINYFHLHSSLSVIMYLFIMIYCALRFGFNLKKILVNNILYMIILCIVQSTIILLFYALLGVVTQETQVLISMLSLMIIVLLLRKCRLGELSKILQRKEALIVLAMIVLIISLFLFIVYFKQNGSFDILYYLVLFVSVILIVLAAIDIGKHKMKAREVEAELRLHKLYEESFKNLIDDMRAKQHEFDNHINVLDNLNLVYKDYESLVIAQKAYCKDLMEENQYNKLLSNGNPIILGFLYGKFLEAKRKGIDINYKIVISQLECVMPVYKIVELLGNLINNAIDELTDNDEADKLEIVIIEDDREIYIEVGNEAPQINYNMIQGIFKKGVSKKGKNRGYGLYNVKKICEEYSIDIKCKIKEKNIKWVTFELKINKPG